jgi:hypothetical protein
MLRSLVERRITMFVVFLRMLHVSLVSLLRILSSFRMYGLERILHNRHRLCWIL